jgi:hypothetical protein
MSSGSSHLSVGISFALAGASSLMAGLLQASWLPRKFLTLTGSSLATICGFVLLLGGFLIALFAFQRREEAPDVVPAEVAFASRMTMTGPVVSIASAPHVASASMGIATRHRASAPAPPPARDERLAPLDTEIRELTRKISKAGVMLATGQISKQGYVSFVDELKRQRGTLEAKRVEMEMLGKL